MTYINIVSLDNTGGLGRHIRLLSQVLRDAGFIVAVNAIHRSALDRAIHRAAKLVRHYPFDINVFIEHIHADALPLARINCLVPNQEWLRDECLPYLAKMDRILCQTKHAHQIFLDMGCNAVFTSFTSLDRLAPTGHTDYGRFFHLAGNSLQKGTAAVIDLWSRHPDWPVIKIVQNPANTQQVTARNIDYVAEHLDDDLLKEYQNAYGIHLCPSEAEGFGHTIVEGMSCRAVVITTNGSPMNDIVTPDRGLLADPSAAEPQRLGTKYLVDSQALEQKVIEVMRMSDETKGCLGNNARRWYEENDSFFRRAIVEVLQRIS